jgi:transcriptional regulator with AAA-type ATPase domain
MNTTMDEDATTLPFVETVELISIRGGHIEVPDEGARVPVGLEPLLIGRARRCAIVLDDDTVSAVHAEVQATPIGLRLVDLKSRNGTFFGDIQVTEAHLNGPFDFRCGGTRLRFVPDAPKEVLVDRARRFAGLAGTTSEMLEMLGLLKRFAPSSMPIVIRGETGTGKERVARAIHEASPRRRRPFLAVNCAAMPDSLLEAELFGHVKGAFTGAQQERKGLFVEAHGGTLFFDEVAEMSTAMQAKVLRALENGEVRPVGSDRTRKVDVRTLFATHVDLRDALNRGRFREDLYFRIANVTVEIPPLRNRLQDIGLLLQSILDDLGRPDVKVSDSDLAMLSARSWPGNIRELKNLVEVALFGASGNTISLEEAWHASHIKEKVEYRAGLYDTAKRDFERRFYTGLFASCRGNVSRIARLAGRQRSTVREALREIGLVAAADPDAEADAEGGKGPDPKGTPALLAPARRMDP